MTRKKNIYKLALPILVLAIAGLACSGGYRTSSKISGNSGEVRLQKKEISGAETTSLEIHEDWSWDRITATATLSMGGGSCQVTLSGDEHSSLSLSASAGQPAAVTGELVLDAFGDVDLKTDCQNGQELDLTVSFTRR